MQTCICAFGHSSTFDLGCWPLCDNPLLSIRLLEWCFRSEFYFLTLDAGRFATIPFLVFDFSKIGYGFDALAGSGDAMAAEEARGEALPVEARGETLPVEARGEAFMVKAHGEAFAVEEIRGEAFTVEEARGEALPVEAAHSETSVAWAHGEAWSDGTSAMVLGMLPNNSSAPCKNVSAPMESFIKAWTATASGVATVSFSICSSSYLLDDGSTIGHISSCSRPLADWVSLCGLRRLTWTGVVVVTRP